MAEIPGQAAFKTAYDRLAAAVESLTLDADSQIRKVALKTLEEMRERIEHDPAFVEQLVERVHGASSAKVIEEPGNKLPES